MDALSRLAEARLAEAVERGDFDGLPGMGQPLELEDLSGVPAELRASYLLLKGANVLPEEMQLKQRMLQLGDLIAACEDDGERGRLRREQRASALRYELLMDRRRARPLDPRYARQVHTRLSRRR